ADGRPNTSKEDTSTKDATTTASTIELGPCPVIEPPGPVENDLPEDALCGVYEVPENRATGEGRMLEIDVIVLPATGPKAKPDPIFPIAGGPGSAVTESAPWWADAPEREKRDIVFVDQRGTNGSHLLDCPPLADDPQVYLEPYFEIEAMTRCRDELMAKADLTQYGTDAFVDDLNDVRAALGYDQINLMGGSYGSRASLVYMRRHPETVRTANLSGLAPPAFRNPLYHAQEAQNALEAVLAQCRADRECLRAYGDLTGVWEDVLDELEASPAEVEIVDRETQETHTVTLARGPAASGLRVFMYSTEGSRRVPKILHAAKQGDLSPLASAAMGSSRALDRALAEGQLLSVVCAEDLARIDPAEIDPLTENTFLGAQRVRDQMAACAIWPERVAPSTMGDAVDVEVPTLLLSGAIDPVTGPWWGEEAASHLPNSLHIIAPIAHYSIGDLDCLDQIDAAFLDAGSVDGLDVSCVAEMDYPPFELPGDDES
ncbi:MAG: alpha/beta fold hydrolase, partial [Acidobacteriota bacterium]